MIKTTHNKELIIIINYKPSLSGMEVSFIQCMNMLLSSFQQVTNKCCTPLHAFINGMLAREVNVKIFH